MKKLPLDFYQQENIFEISQQLLGKYLFTNFEHQLTGGIIVETEAYRGEEDRASHAFGGRRTARNEVLYHEGGHCYVYLCYGLHHLLNIVTNQKGIPHGVLIRAIEPTTGIETMLKRRGASTLRYTLTAGPGALTKALGITTRENGTPLNSNAIWIEDRGIVIPSHDIIASPRVGIDYAKEHAQLHWRFRIKGNPWTSRAK